MEPLYKFFRSSNSQLLYPISKFEKIFRTGIFLISQKLYRRHMKNASGSGKKIIDNVDRNLRLEVDLRFSIGAAFYFLGFHEWTTWRYLQLFLKPEMVMFDIGSNQGEYALFAAKRLQKGKVYAFEPLPEMVAQINRNLQLNGFNNVEVMPVGLAEADGTAEIFDSGAANEGLATLYQSNDRNASLGKIVLKQGDAVVTSLNLSRLDILKIDVEGAEFTVLKGLEQTLLRYKPVLIIEMSSVTFEAAGYTPEDLISWLTTRGYSMNRITKSGGLIPFEGAVTFENVVFTSST